MLFETIYAFIVPIILSVVLIQKRDFDKAGCLATFIGISHVKGNFSEIRV